jgi:penicillin amidase
MRTIRLGALVLLPLFAAACDETIPNARPDASVVDSGPAPLTYPYEGVEQKESLKGDGLAGPVDVVRDTMGIPHIFAATVPDASYAQGYFMARDRWLQMDFARRQAAGTLTEIVGAVNPQAILSDINYRTHQMRKTAEATLKTLEASSDETDKILLASLRAFAKGVNAWQADLAAGKYALPAQLASLYTKASVSAWSPEDCLLLGELQAFQLSFNADAEIQRTRTALAEQTEFVNSADLERKKRVGFADDYGRFAPFDATYTVDGWSQVTASLLPKPGNKGRAARAKEVRSELALLDRASRGLKGVGLNMVSDPSRGSNNWVVGPQLSATGHAMVANDTHLSLSNPAIFYLNHITTGDGLDVMGVQFPGIPLVTLGMTRKLSWGSTVSYIDVTDVYQEEVVDCTSGGGKCVKFKGGEVKLTERKEDFKIGALGTIDVTRTYSYYDVPHHGPIIPNVQSGAVVGLSGRELSIRYTGYEPGRLLRAVYGLSRATNVKDGMRELEAHFTHGGQNWVLADMEGNIAWTQTVRTPKRPKGTKPWAVLPGDGSAEWAGFWEAKQLPQSYNPAKGYLVTANADPLGVTADNDPANEPEVDGVPKYMGWNYDPGTREGRITKRIQEGIAGGKKLSADDMSSIQADAISDFGRAFLPVFLASAKALDDENKAPGTHPELTALLAAASPEVKGYLAGVQAAVKDWSFDTPAGMASENPSAKQIADSRAALIMAAWNGAFARAVIGDEVRIVGAPLYLNQSMRLLQLLVTDPSKLRVGEALYDDLDTPEIETKSVTTAKSVLATLDFLFKNVGANPEAWRWGQVHTLTPRFFASVGLDLPATPRHGGDGTVDVASHGIASNDFTFRSGAAIRFVCEMDPQKGPIARNALPGGEIFDPSSPHYSDFFELWKKNQAAALPFQSADVVARAQEELTKNQIGRTRFAP